MTTPQERVQVFKKVSFDFKRIFNKSITPYADMFCGFNLTKFEKDICVSDDMSISDFVTINYGKEAHILISNLILI